MNPSKEFGGVKMSPSLSFQLLAVQLHGGLVRGLRRERIRIGINWSQLKESYGTMGQMKETWWLYLGPYKETEAHRLSEQIVLGRPVMVMCVVFTTLPSFSFSIAVTEVKKNNGPASPLPETLPDLPVSLVLTSLIVVDIIEKLRIYPLRGQQKSNEDRHIHTTTLQQIKTVTDQVKQKEENTSPPQLAWTTQASQPSATRTQISTPVLRVPQEPVFHSRVLKAMSLQDDRAQIFLWSFVLWSDTIEMVRVAGHPSVYKSGWLFPVYIFSFISILRIILTPQNPLLNFLSILLQDLPFIFVRLGLIIALGTVTPVLGLCKNVLVTFSYIYFNYLTKIWAFSTFETSSF